MRAINHALTGAVIGLALGEPALALPAALVSHYVCDAIPHQGAKEGGPAYIRSKEFRYLLYMDAVLCLALVGVLALRQPLNWELAALCAFTAAAPDFLSLDRFRNAIQRKPFRPRAYSRFAHGIQWFERPIGAVVEVAWLAAGIFLLSPFLF